MTLVTDQVTSTSSMHKYILRPHELPHSAKRVQHNGLQGPAPSLSSLDQHPQTNRGCLDLPCSASKYVWAQAARKAPSIIFLDELDGLVPARASNSSSSDQVFASVVATLLALMDGVLDRGAVVVIGATNR